VNGPDDDGGITAAGIDQARHEYQQTVARLLAGRRRPPGDSDHEIAARAAQFLAPPVLVTPTSQPPGWVACCVQGAGK
jgi:hypothetical protein